MKVTKSLVNTARLALCTLALGMLSVGASAAVWCTENVTQLYNGADGNVYFTTNLTCTSYCELIPNTGISNGPDYVKRSFALMQESMILGTSVTINWPSITSCTTGANALYAAPAIISITP